MENWKTYKLGEVADVQNGFAFKSTELGEEGIPVIKIKNIVSPNVILEGAGYYIGEIEAKHEKYILKRNDFLISMTGSTVNVMSSAVGKMGKYRLDDFSLINQRVGKIYITDTEKADFDYVCHFLNRYEINYFLALNATGSANQANISPAQIKDLDLLLPPIIEQRAIASILSTIDDKIEINLQMNKTLEEMAMTLYKHWFVDFGPFQEGEFVESDLGMIPKGWEVKRLSSLANFKNGKGLKNESKSPDGQYNLFGSNGVIGKTDDVMFNEPVVAIGRVGANYGEVHYSMCPCWISDNAITVQPMNQGYFWWLLQTLRLIDYTQFVGGSAQPLITQGAIKEVNCTVPNMNELINFSNKLDSLFCQLQNNISENQTLTTLRDTLLPKLISGEVRVKEAEKILEEAV